MGDRRLVSLRRRVPRERREEYARLWVLVQREAEERGAHAWRFASTIHPESHLEFLEFRNGSDPRAAAALTEALAALEAISLADVEEWEGG